MQISWPAREGNKMHPTRLLEFRLRAMGELSDGAEAMDAFNSLLEHGEEPTSANFLSLLQSCRKEGGFETAYEIFR